MHGLRQEGLCFAEDTICLLVPGYALVPKQLRKTQQYYWHFDKAAIVQDV